jgi:hypothetical protein
LEPVDPQDFLPLPFAKDRLLDSAREFDRRRRSNVEMVSEDDTDDGSEPVMGGAGGAESEDQESWARGLHAWAVKHHRKLGLATPTVNRPIAVDGFFTSQRMDADGYLQSQITVQFVQRDRQQQEDLGGLVPMGGATVVADGEGHVRYVIAKTLPGADDERMAQLRGFVASVENRLTSTKWSLDPSRRIIERLNLRSLHARG